MGAFLTISRREMVELETPWDPQRLIDDYFGDLQETHRDGPSPEDTRELAHGGILRLDMEHRRLGTVAAELHLRVVSPVHLEVELAAALALKWWWWPLAMPFRHRIRRLLNRRIDQMIGELAEAPSTMDGQDVPDEESSVAPAGGVRTSLQILTTDGRQIYHHSEGSA